MKTQEKKSVIYPDLCDKIVVITGGGQGIGKGLVTSFINQGCAVVVITRSDAPWFDDINHDNKHAFIKSDIRDTASIASWLEEHEKKGKKIDVLINNAATIVRRPLVDCSEDDWNNIMDVNCKATFFLSQLFAKHMMKNGGGNIIHAASFAAKMPSMPYSLYSASKSVIASFTRSMSAEWAPHNIRVNSFSPGVIETQMTKPAIDNNGEKMLQDISLQRFGNVDEVAKAVMFLASEASSYITGADIDISGGKFSIQNPHAPWNNKKDSQ
ncbi:MAG: SDR family oxidoreductase [Waddliaceae bacterium]|mgnify:CR=1 FL=1|jgi:3-oxoacyl-[acyl-carrier protein] reductase|nr:SDR family oxidoreductase [Waddliaceae bacterium]MBT3579002.1 SDR family oxidoreductase [Waddliaceae bacterium]MBT4444973.1 SDR family oxidoreductase [Waddliaceae bacterium]MBT6928594.1 SDR family oxidoreductase [Waddliaceae bacterium]MBT7264253.1 SDR family oxidoreductase [Waddliaceae bacterium]